MLVVRDLCTGLLIYSNMNARVRYLPNVVRGCVRSTAALDALVGRLARSTESSPSSMILASALRKRIAGRYHDIRHEWIAGEHYTTHRIDLQYVHSVVQTLYIS